VPSNPPSSSSSSSLSPLPDTNNNAPKHHYRHFGAVQGRVQGAINLGFIPTNCHALYLKETSLQPDKHINQVKFISHKMKSWVLHWRRAKRERSALCASAYLSVCPDNKKKKKKKNLFVKFNKNNNNNKTDTLTGCQKGYIPINAGRL